MLLNHSSGFPDISMLQLDLRCADPTRLVSPDELIAKGIKLPRAKFAPGKGSRYSSLNTIVLGRILEKITGESFAALLTERLLKPLALHRTKLDTDGKLDPPFCHGYTDFCRDIPTRQSGPSSLLPPGRWHRRCQTCIGGASRWEKGSASHQHFARHALTTSLVSGSNVNVPAVESSHSVMQVPKPGIQPTCNSTLARAPSGRSWLTAMAAPVRSSCQC